MMSSSGGGADEAPPPGGVPVAQYEALLAEVRGLRRRAQRVQRLARPLLAGESRDGSGHRGTANRIQHDLNEPLDYTMDSLLLGRSSSPNSDRPPSNQSNFTSEDEYFGQGPTTRSHLSVSSEPARGRANLDGLYHGTWPVERSLWSSEPTSLGQDAARRENNASVQMEVTSVMSFASSSGGVPLDSVLADRTPKWTNQQLEAKMDVVHSLLSMLGSQDHIDMGETLLALSSCPESCLAMRQSGCIPLLVQLVQSDKDGENRKNAAQALHNLVNSQPDEKIRKRESRILKLLEQARLYTECLRNNTTFELESSSISASSDDPDKHPVQTIAHLMKLSFDEGHRQAICQLGGIHTIAHLVEGEHLVHSSATTEAHCVLLRRYACMALTNLTFGDSGNKALLCSYKDFMRSLVVQLQSPCDELRQVTASVLRNLSWRADSTSKEILREVGSVPGLMKAAMLDNKENTLKSILSALWNLSAHCTENKAEICSVEGALGFLVSMLTYKTPSKSLAIIENSGGILRNISSQIAVREDYREVLRKHNCLKVLLEQLKSPSLTIVSNACGTLWNLSAKSSTDQEALWQMGAPAMLRSLNHSKHKMIAMGSSAALKNLLSAKPNQGIIQQLDSTALNLNLPELPTLGARKQKALLQDLDANLSETYENIEKDSPVKIKNGKMMEFIQKPQKDLKDDLNQAFSSLNVSEPSTSYNFKQNSNFGPSSLPFVQSPIKRGNPCTYIPVRNKYSDYDEENDVSDQPIDYSRKYLENKNMGDRNKGNAEKSSSFGIYAETDLDQPTDYSLRYAEDDSDSDICEKSIKNEQQEFDTVKTYCTEGTPYETPFIISNATSMSDLRDKQPIDNDIQKETSKKIKEIRNQDEKDHCSTEDISEIENATKQMDKIPKSEFSSGLMSPEKPVNYAEEGTPGYFSRVSSFGSLNSIPANETVVEKKSEEVAIEKDEMKKETPEKVTTRASVSKGSTEMKNVKFETTVNYAEQTPLMFSRSSSLASLDSIEQHSIHDDRSSVVSDFSCLTSGIMSPSELPDSPTQTMPPSPKPRLSTSSGSSRRKTSETKSKTPPKPTVHKPSVFEDNVTRFKEESTPIQFSTATSLSSLVIDDQESIGAPEGAKVLENRVVTGASSSTNTNAESVVHKEDSLEKKDTEKEARSGGEFVKRLEADRDGVKDVSACVNDRFSENYTQSTEEPGGSKSLTKRPLTDANSSTNTNAESVINKEESVEKKDTEKETSRQELNNKSEANSDEDEAILLACINDGMKNNRYTTRIPAVPGRPAADASSSTNTNTENVIDKDESLMKKDTEKETKIIGELNNKSEADSEEDEAILLACINDGMKNNRYTTHVSEMPARPAASANNKSEADSDEDEAILLACINDGMKNNRYKTHVSNMSARPTTDTNNKSEADSDEDEAILLACINDGMKNNRYKTSVSDTPARPAADTNNKSEADSDEDEAILLACINDGMKNNRYTRGTPTATTSTPSKLPTFKSQPKQTNIPSVRKSRNGQDEAPTTYCTEDTPAQLSRIGSNSNLSGLSTPNDRKGRGDYFCDDLNNLSGENDFVAKSEKNANKRSIPLKRGNRNVSSEGNSSRGEALKVQRDQTGRHSPVGMGANVSELSARISRGLNQLQSASGKSQPSSSKNEEPKLNISQENNEEQQRKESLSSVSSLGSSDEALLQECIRDGIANVAKRPLPPVPNERKYNMNRSSRGNASDDRERSELDSYPKNARAAPAAGAAAGAGGGGGVTGAGGRPRSPRRPPRGGRRPGSCSPSGATCCAAPATTGSSLDLRLDPADPADRLNRSCEAAAALDNRMLDPDAMIESLDRFTAELVSQASHLNNKVSTSDNTWNEESSPNELTFPSISGSAPNVITFESESSEKDVVDGLNDNVSNEFTSINTSTMTESTLIAMEATKMATVFRNEADMSQSITGAISLDLDSIRPPSQMNSLTNSFTNVPKSPKLLSRKKSLPAGLLVKRALSNSLNRSSSVESLENNSISNLECVNPPSELQNVLDMEGSVNSIGSIGSIPHDEFNKIDFKINVPLKENIESTSQHPIFNIKNNFLENINPPSIFNEITDMCNSLADIPTEAIGSETEIFEDCCTHLNDATLQEDITEFSDANSITPIQSDISSTESSPKKSSKLTKSMMTKQRRDIARDRYKTYVVGAEIIMREEISKQSDDFKTANDISEASTYVSPTYSVEPKKTTPRERRQMDRSRYETQTLDESVTSNLPVIEPLGSSSNGSSPAQSPARTKLSIRRNFMQKRIENRDRFKTQTLSESSLQNLESPPVVEGQDIHMLVEKEANLVLKTLANTKMMDEMLDCETLSLVSNDDDSEHNSCGSVNYRTYRKSLGMKQGNIPVIEPLGDCDVNSTQEDIEKVASKPKIVKPIEKIVSSEEETALEEQPKGIRGRRKPLYSKTNINNTKSIKPAKNITSNLVKNVTSTLKSNTSIKPTVTKQNRTINTRPPVPSRPISTSNSPKTSPARVPKSQITPKNTKATPSPPLERQGTFTKEESPKAAVKQASTSKIPSFTSKIARAITPNRLQGNNNVPKGIPVRNGNSGRIYNRSTSADSRETGKSIQASPSTQSLKSEVRSSVNGAVKKSSIPSPAKRSDSSGSITPKGPNSARKQVTSKIASIWKKIEESKNKPQKKDGRVWIQNEPEAPRLIRSNTFENKEAVILRPKGGGESSVDGDPTKRVSRLGSFIVVDENGEAPRQVAAHV